MWTNDINELNSSTCAWRGGAWSSKSPNGAAEIDVASRRPSSGLRQMTVRQKCRTDDSKALRSGQAESAVNEDGGAAPTNGCCPPLFLATSEDDGLVLPGVEVVPECTDQFMMDEPEIATRILGIQIDSLGSEGSISTKVFEAD